jgi:hypothetical protein
MSVSTTRPEVTKEAVGAGIGAGAQLLAFAETLALALWLGGMAFFSFALAPSAFGVLPTRNLAGMIVNSTIAKVEIIGLVAGPLLLLILFATWRARPSARIIRASLLVVMVACAALSRFWVSATMNSIRSRMGSIIDELPATDPLRVQFNDLHGYSVSLMGAAMLAGVALLFFTVRSWLKR